MAQIVVVGAGVVALGTAMLLAGDGHRVAVLERDPEGPPDDPVEAWERWQRPGLNQFRMAHAFLAGFRAIIDAELPAVSTALADAGGLRLNFIRDVLPAQLSGGWQDGDERYEWLTGRRVVVEAVLAAAAEATPGVEVRRGVAVAGLTTGASAQASVPHVTGVRTRDGEDIPADLVVDMSGRRSALPGWLQDIGARPPGEELEDSGLVYFGRQPVATGVVAVADSWACTNPTNGRGASIGLLHALTLRNQLRTVGLDDPAAFARAFHAATTETVEPWYRATLTSDRHRLGEIEAGIRGVAYDSPDPAYQLEKALDLAVQQDPECLRASLDTRLVLRTPEDVFARPGLRDKTLRLGSHWRDEPPFGPTREQILSLVSAP